MLLLGRRPARMRPAPLARTSVLPRQNLGAGGIQFRRAFQSFQRNPWGACAPRNRPHHNRSHDIKDIHSCSRFLSYFYAVVGPSSGAYAPPRLRRVRAFCRRQNLGAGGIHFRRAFQSFQRNPWGACAPRNRPHHNGSHDIKDVHSCSKFLSYFSAVVGPSSGGAHPVEDVHSMWISLLCQGETARQGCRALQLTGSACQIVKRALQLIRDGGQVMSVRKKALDREGCFYYALALGIELGRLSAKG